MCGDNRNDLHIFPFCLKRPPTGPLPHPSQTQRFGQILFAVLWINSEKPRITDFLWSTRKEVFKGASIYHSCANSGNDILTALCTQSSKLVKSTGSPFCPFHRQETKAPIAKCLIQNCTGCVRARAQTGLQLPHSSHPTSPTGRTRFKTHIGRPNAACVGWAVFQHPPCKSQRLLILKNLTTSKEKSRCSFFLSLF